MSGRPSAGLRGARTPPRPGEVFAYEGGLGKHIEALDLCCMHLGIDTVPLQYFGEHFGPHAGPVVDTERSRDHASDFSPQLP